MGENRDRFPSDRTPSGFITFRIRGSDADLLLWTQRWTMSEEMLEETLLHQNQSNEGAETLELGSSCRSRRGPLVGQRRVKFGQGTPHTRACLRTRAHSLTHIHALAHRHTHTDHQTQSLGCQIRAKAIVTQIVFVPAKLFCRAQCSGLARISTTRVLVSTGAEPAPGGQHLRSRTAPREQTQEPLPRSFAT